MEVLLAVNSYFENHHYNYFHCLSLAVHVVSVCDLLCTLCGSAHCSEAYCAVCIVQQVDVTVACISWRDQLL